jgi:hypothetical protein
MELTTATTLVVPARFGTDPRVAANNSAWATCWPRRAPSAGCRGVSRPRSCRRAQLPWHEWRTCIRRTTPCAHHAWACPMRTPTDSPELTSSAIEAKRRPVSALVPRARRWRCSTLPGAATVLVVHARPMASRRERDTSHLQVSGCPSTPTARTTTPRHQHVERTAPHGRVQRRLSALVSAPADRARQRGP